MKTQVGMILASLAGWMSRKQQEVIEYLLAENRILKEELNKRDQKLRLNDEQRRRLALAGNVLGRKGLLQYASIATPDTIMRWHRRLVARKYTAKRKIRHGEAGADDHDPGTLR